MIKIDKAIVVEGKYDKIKLSRLVDATIIQTDGFKIFKDKEKIELVKFYAKRNGILVITDSDAAGFKIRAYLKSIVGKGKIDHLYIPDILGKEKRKVKPSKEGKLGVEGMEDKILMEKLNTIGVKTDKVTAQNKITVVDLYELGLVGQDDSSNLRRMLCEYLNLPKRLSTKCLIDILSDISTLDEVRNICNKLKL